MKVFPVVVPFFLLLSHAASAATISYAGSDLTTGSGWRTSSVSKPLDADGNNIYGSDGYFLATSPGGALFALPSYVSAISNLGLSFYQGSLANPQYTFVDHPTASGLIQTGVWYQNSNNGIEDNILTFTLSQSRNFRLGVLVDTSGFTDVSPSSLRLRQTTGGSANSGLNVANSGANLSGDWYFFNVSGVSGDVFTLSGINWYNGSAAQFSNGVAGLSFDTPAPVPEPATGSLIGLALAALALRKYKKV